MFNIQHSDNGLSYSDANSAFSSQPLILSNATSVCVTVFWLYLSYLRICLDFEVVFLLTITCTIKRQSMIVLKFLYEVADLIDFIFSSFLFTIFSSEEIDSVPFLSRSCCLFFYRISEHFLESRFHINDD